jgi:hypothetical protein
MLYIIKPQEDARWRVMRYKGGFAAIDDMHHTSRGDDIPLLSQWINKKGVTKCCSFFMVISKKTTFD